jgi:hypothetical protein
MHYCQGNVLSQTVGWQWTFALTSLSQLSGIMSQYYLFTIYLKEPWVAHTTQREMVGPSVNTELGSKRKGAIVPWFGVISRRLHGGTEKGGLVPRLSFEPSTFRTPDKIVTAEPASRGGRIWTICVQSVIYEYYLNHLTNNRGQNI